MDRTDCKDGRGNSEEDLGAYLSSIVVVELTQVPIVMTFSIFIPSLFKFVTGSPYIGEFENSGQVCTDSIRSEADLNLIFFDQ